MSNSANNLSLKSIYCICSLVWYSRVQSINLQELLVPLCTIIIVHSAVALFPFH